MTNFADNQMKIDDVTGEVTYLISYDRHIDIPINSAVLGPTAPAIVITGNAGGRGFNADAELATFEFEVPKDWDGITDMQLEVLWHPEDGDVIQDTEDVKWNFSYNSIADGEPVDNGTPVNITSSYTQSGGGIDKQQIVTILTIDFDNVNQPLTVGDTVYVKCNRDKTGESNSYSGLAIIGRWEIKFKSNKRAFH